jgi:hypothetical protein
LTTSLTARFTKGAIMFVIIAGAAAGVIVVLFLAAITVAASSGTSRQPYGGTPAYHPSHQHVRIGAVSYDSDWQQTTLTRSLEMGTGAMYLKYTVEGAPDAVLQDQPFMATMAVGMLQASSNGYAPYGDADRSQVEAGHGRLAIPSRTYPVWNPADGYGW